MEVTEKSQKEINELLESHKLKRQAKRIEKEPLYEEEPEEDEEIPQEQDLGDMPNETDMEGEFDEPEDSVHPDEDHEQAPGEERVEPTSAPTHKPSDEL